MTDHDAARNAGMRPRDAARYAAYCAMRRRKGLEPIDAQEAARQIREVRPL